MKKIEPTIQSSLFLFLFVFFFISMFLVERGETLLAGTNTHYVLTSNYSGITFFDNWRFFTGDDPTHGTVDYVSRQAAEALQLTGMRNNGQIYIGTNYNSAVAPNARGRPAVRLESLKTWEKALFVMDVEHVPTGCGTWPTWWLLGDDWPNQGEVDIIEGVNTVEHDTSTLHTGRGCTMPEDKPDDDDDPGYYSGEWATGPEDDPATDCWVGNPEQFPNQGCGIQAKKGTLGPKLNRRRGGVFAFEWTDKFMRTWYFKRRQIPQDLQCNPDPNTWATPFAYFPLSDSIYNTVATCPPSTFGPQQMIINLTFCGDYAGSQFSDDCPDIKVDCDTFVRENPEAFQEAYWLINSVTVYEMMKADNSATEATMNMI